MDFLLFFTFSLNAAPALTGIWSIRFEKSQGWLMYPSEGGVQKVHFLRGGQNGLFAYQILVY